MKVSTKHLDHHPTLKIDVELLFGATSLEFNLTGTPPYFPKAKFPPPQPQFVGLLPTIKSPRKHWIER
jgi:hypothetical protein